MSFAVSGRGVAAGLLCLAAVSSAHAAEFEVTPIRVEDLKSVFARVESRDTVFARARIAGSVLSIDVDEGSAVTAGQVIAVIGDEKLRLRLDANDAAVRSLTAQLETARTELDRSQSLFASGTIPKARLDQVRTQFDILNGQLAAAKAERAVVVQQAKEGQVMAPGPGRVLKVAVTPNSVVLAGETVATIAGGGYFLRLALPERHAARLAPGDPVLVGERGLDEAAARAQDVRATGRLVKVYPQIEDGHVIADAEVDGLGDFFVGERVRVHVAVGEREILAVPPEAVTLRFGVDYVKVSGPSGARDVAVVTGRSLETANGPRTEILSGLAPGDRVLVP